MSRSVSTETLPPTARSIALLLASTPTISDAQPGVLHQLLEFSHRYTSQVLSDALVYAEHAGRPGKIEMEDVVLAIQARVGWEFGGRIPKEYMLNLAAQTNAIPLPSVPEVFGVRLPASAHCLTNVNFDLVPNKPPPSVKQYDEEVEEIEEESEDEAMIGAGGDVPMPSMQPGPSFHQAYSDADMASPEPAVMNAGEDTVDDDDGLFDGKDDDSDGDDVMESVIVPEIGSNGVKRKLVEEDDYD